MTKTILTPLGRKVKNSKLGGFEKHPEALHQTGFISLREVLKSYKFPFERKK